MFEPITPPSREPAQTPRMENEMTLLQAERLLDADILPLPVTDRSPAAPVRAPRAAPPLPLADEGEVPDDDATVLVPSSLVGLSLALAQASMLWPVLRPV